MRKTLFLFLLLCIKASSQTNISGNLSGTLTLASSPYLVQGHLMVQPNTTVVIQPGVVLEFQNHFKLNVQGVLQARGNVIDSIKFRMKPSMASVGWWGIRFELTAATQDSSILEYCKISGGRATGSGDDINGGGIFIKQFNNVRVTHCSIFDNRASNGSGIELHSTSAIIDNNDISFNVTHGPWSSISGAGIHCDTLCTSRISNNSISSNTLGAGWGAGIGCTCSSPNIFNNNIHNNTSNWEAGGISVRGSGSPTITGNQIRSNDALSGGGIRISEVTYPIITKNVIDQNVVYATGGTQAYGGGILFAAAYLGYAEIIDNVISRNYASNMGGGIWALNSNPVTIKGNTIHANNSASGGGAMLMQIQPIMQNNVFSNNEASIGGAIYAVQNFSEAVYSGNLFNNNTSYANGGALYLESSSPRISNCTFANNLANTLPSYTTYLYGGAGLLCTSASNPTITNCIFWGNRANSQNGHQIYLEDNASDPPILYTDLEGGLNDIYTNGSVYSGTFTNNIAVNPLFVAASGGVGNTFSAAVSGWSLQPSSPCINNGKPDTTGLKLPLNDIVGLLRVKGIIDRGAFESPNCGSFAPDPKFIQIGPTFSVTAPGTNIQWVHCTTQFSISGATGPAYTPTANGAYAVMMTQFGCSGVSDCIAMNDVGIAEFEKNGIRVFPNPVNDKLFIQSESGAAVEFSIYDSDGKLILRDSVNANEGIDLSDLAAGIYFLIGDITGERIGQKIIVQ